MKNQNKKILTLLIIAFVLSYVAATVLKIAFKLPRPCDVFDNCPESFSFPSRHAAVVFALASIFVSNIRQRNLQYAAISAAFIFSFYRVVFGYHTYADFFGGAALGILVGIVVQKAFKPRK